MEHWQLIDFTIMLSSSLEALLDVDPGTMHGRIIDHLGVDRIGGEQQGRWFSGGGEHGRQSLAAVASLAEVEAAVPSRLDRCGDLSS
jgi:hypothetical protein